jgi:GDP/UDP-N,N'-diacetylbacillosamine 2-epimerase (hydrolysing)
MGTNQIKRILVLTSSRADFGIYLPLLKKIRKNKSFDLKILAFGTHLSKFHGYTIDQIREAGFKVDYQISSLLAGDEPVDIATAFSLTSLKFAEFWNSQRDNFDWVLVLGDRYEMAAAVLAGIPFGIPFAHLYGGETTLGAIDNFYRHTISQASKLHFVSLDQFKLRIEELLFSTQHDCLVVGSLSLDNLAEVKLLSRIEFYEKWQIDLNKKSILITIHPETVDFRKNEDYSNQVYGALKIIGLNRQLIITMPNADTSGTIYRDMFKKLKLELDKNIILIENFGTQSYFTCMKLCGLMIGNTSSGITEAASFKKYVINIGDRQKGRPTSKNVISIPFNVNDIISTTENYFDKQYFGENIYYKANTTKNIIKQLIK